MRRVVAAILVGLAMVATTLAGIVPAHAGPTDGGGQDTCSQLSGSTTLANVLAAIGGGGYHGLKGKSAIDGEGIDVAVIDTGVSNVGSLSGSSDTFDGPDLSFDALDANLRHGDLHGHGTNMAGIIKAVAPKSRIVDVKVGAADGAVDVTQVVAAIDWVVEHKNANGLNIRVINLSYSNDAAVAYQTGVLSFAVEHAWRNGIVVVAAGGNDGRGIHRLGNPAINPFIIAVGASEKKPSGTWSVPTFSSTGDGTRNPDVVAPGSSILSLGVRGSFLANAHSGATCEKGGDLYLRGSGTSQAAAVVSGAVAMLLDQRPSLTPNQVKKLLTSTATNLGQPNKMQGAGMLNLEAALAATTPSHLGSVQPFSPASGLGSLDNDRGSAIVGTAGDQLLGNMTAFGGAWSSTVHATKALAGATWTGVTWSGATWTGGTWSGATWTGATWSGATWSGATWTGATWSGATWSGATWSGATWSGATWSGATWSGATWSGATWSGVTWS